MANATDDSSIRYSEEGGVKLMQLKLQALKYTDECNFTKFLPRYAFSKLNMPRFIFSAGSLKDKYQVPQS